jgi:predicted phage baseplate assembly protein
MAFETPRLDDRAFQDIIEEARQRITLYCPEWTDHNVSDPGIALIELFSWMTDIVLYRLNRVPEKHLIRFMQLVGMQPEVGTAATVRVLFWLKKPRASIITIKAGTQVATTRTEQEEAIIFTTLADENIYVPRLSYLFSSTRASDMERTYSDNYVETTAREEAESAHSFRSGVEFFTSSEPRIDDALYFGFKQDISYHILGMEMTLEEKRGASVQPDNPPIRWEALGLVEQDDPTKAPIWDWIEVNVEQDSTLGLNATGTVQLYLPQMTQTERNQYQAFWIRCRLIDRREDNRYDVSPELNAITVASWGRSTEAQNFTMIENEVLGRSDGTPGQRFFLRHTPVIKIPDRHSVLDHAGRGMGQELIVKLPDEDGTTERWEMRDHFADSGRDDNHYTLRQNDGEVRFGPALPAPDGSVRSYGRIPPKGAMIIMQAYQYGGGIEGNVSENTINVLKTAIPYIDRVENREPASGGRDAETLDHAMMRFQNHMRSLDRAVTPADFEYLARKAVSNIGRVACIMPRDASERGLVQLVVVPQVIHKSKQITFESLKLSPDLRRDIHDYLDHRRLLGTRLEITPPNYRWIMSRISVTISTRVRMESMREKIETALYRFLNPLIGGSREKGWPLGQDISSDDISGMIRNISGVESVAYVELFEVQRDAEDGTVLGYSQSYNRIPLNDVDVVASYEHEVFVDYDYD